ncbi:PEP-CTERM sorting domain-containing protein [Thalassotalea sp. PLHSN55]|uniref:PEP-CTERM sorting domain-containing protein n=1 Tax=Thalassotalea sp. PLHSN55 TaxID=3435888 RepID=UPI003F86B3B6
MKFFKTLVLSVSLLITATSQAAFITTNEASLDAIFSQASFGNMPIDIRIGAATELVFPDLLDIDTNAEIATLFAQHVGLATVVNFYFVDTISACGGINPAIVGCGEFPGNDFVVESSFAASGFGGELLAHELGHNLGLPHINGAFLMDPALNGQTLITDNEVNIIRNSPLVQTDGQFFWVDINPVLIVREAIQSVPEPSTLVLFLLSGGLLFSMGKKRAK